MELGKQIKKYRNDLGISQDILAEKVYVSRQTISNWENDKSYPDVNSLLLLSEVFDVSIDILIKGDIKEMKEQVNAADRKQFEKLGKVFSVFFIISIITPIPLAYFLRFVGVGIWVILMSITLYLAFLVEKKKKYFDIQTYKEIIAFSEGKSLDEIAKAREEGKRPYQKVLLAVIAGVITLIVTILIVWLLGVIF